METHMPSAIATGLEFQPLPNGNVQIEFFNDNGESLHQQVVDPAVVRSMSTLAQTTLIVTSIGVGSVVEFLTNHGKTDVAMLT